MFLTMGYGVYLFFGSMMILSIPFCVFFLPETMHVPYVWLPLASSSATRGLYLFFQ